jgi:hypothetical protein
VLRSDNGLNLCAKKVTMGAMKDPKKSTVNRGQTYEPTSCLLQLE